MHGRSFRCLSATLAAGLAVGGVALAGTALASSPVLPSYADFSDTTGLHFNGSTGSNAANNVELTSGQPDQAGSAFFTTPVDLTRSFATTFAFDVSGTDPVGSGFTFTVQSDTRAEAALGGCGAALGYGADAAPPPCTADAISPSVAVAFDVSTSTVTLVEGGDMTPVVASDSVSLTDATPPDAPRQAWVTYDAAGHALSVYVGDAGAARPAAAVLTAGSVDLSTLVAATGYVGFTASTDHSPDPLIDPPPATATATQDIRSWSMTESPVAPTALALTGEASHPGDASQADISLSWTAPADDGGDASFSYAVYRVSGAVRTLAGTSTTTTFVDTVAVGADPTYVVTASNGAGEGPASVPLLVTDDRPPTPTGLGGSVVADPAHFGQVIITLTWTAVTGDGEGGTAGTFGYHVFRSSSSNGPFDRVGGLVPQPAPGSRGSYTDVLPSGPYYYKVAAVNDLGEGNQSVGFGLGVILPPASVLTLQAANTAVALTWLPPAGYPNLTYAVYRATAPGVAVTPANRIASGLTHPTYIDTGLTNDTTYYYVVTGVSGYGEGGPSNEVSGTPFTTPDMPAAVTVAAAGNGEVRVDWVPGSDNGTTRTHFTVTVPGCATCVSPGASPDASSAIVEDVPTGTWTATVQANAVDGNSADGTALDSLIATAPIGATVHTVRFVSQPLGDDAAGPAPAVPGADPTSGNDCTVAPGAAANSVLETKPCATIGRALGLAQPGDEVVVASGTYTEGADDPAASGPTAAATVGAGLWLTQPRELVAQPDTGPVVIDATGHDHGFGVRLGNAGNTVSGTVVTISGFTVRNAGSDGILVADSSHVAVADDVIENSPVGLRLTGVNHATVTRNTLQHNKTGLVLSDADGPVWANTLTGNSVSDNTSGGGILLSAHGSWLTGDAAGIFTNTIKGNSVLRDGAGGAGAGIKLDVAEPGGQIYDNTITGNVVRSTQQAGIVLDAHSVFDYLDDNVITANTISGTGAYRPGGARASTGMALHGTAAAPIGGTVVRANTISAVHVGVFANEAGVSPSPFGFTNVAVHVQRVPAARFVYAVRGHNRHLLTTSGGRAVADRGGSLASAPAVSARPHWTANGYDGSLSAVYAARMTDGSLQYRSDSTPWRAVALPPKVRMAGAPAILGAIWDPAGRSELTLAFTDTGGHVWLRDLILAPDLTVVGTNLPWTSLGTAGGGLAGSPALVVLDSNGFFEPTIFAAGRNGVVYQHDSNTTHPWTRTRFHAAAVAGGLTPDWTTAELVLVTRGAHGNVSTVRNVEGTWAAVHREAIPSTGQPGIALATNGTSLAYVARSGRLSARIGGSTLGFSVRPSMGTGVTALN